MIWERRLYFQTAGEFGGQSGQTRGWLVQGERGVNVEAGATVNEHEHLLVVGVADKTIAANAAFV